MNESIRKCFCNGIELSIVTHLFHCTSVHTPIIAFNAGGKLLICLCQVQWRHARALLSVDVHMCYVKRVRKEQLDCYDHVSLYCRFFWGSLSKCDQVLADVFEYVRLLAFLNYWRSPKNALGAEVNVMTFMKASS